MMQQMGSGAPVGVVERAKAILLTPKSEWPLIAAEPATVSGLYRNYVAILAAIPAVCGLVAGLMWGHGAFGITYRPSVVAALAGAITSYVVTLVGVFLLALIIEALAPHFGGAKSRIQAFKLAAYSGTAAWLAGLFQLIPGLGWLSILGLYGLYLLYLGLPVLMRTPVDRAMPYAAVTVVAAIVLSLLVTTLTAPIAALFAGPATLGDSGTLSGTMTVPGVGAVDLGKLDAASKQIEAAGKRAENGEAAALPPGALQALLPAGIEAFRRTEVSSSSASTGGLGGGRAEAIYMNGDSRITLGITDLGAAGALAALGSAFNVQSSKQTETGYEKVNQIDGRMVTEDWDSAARRGKYTVLVGNRFMVDGEGQGIDIAELKKGVEGIGYARLEALAK